MCGLHAKAVCDASVKTIGHVQNQTSKGSKRDAERDKCVEKGQGVLGRFVTGARKTAAHFQISSKSTNQQD